MRANDPPPPVDKGRLADLARRAEAAAAAGETETKPLRRMRFDAPSIAATADGWKVSGSPEPAPCEHCGELIPVKCSELSEFRRRFFSPEPHDCEGKRQALVAAGAAAREAKLAALRAPTAERIDQVRRQCALPLRSFPGLATLTETEANRAALAAAQAMVTRYQANDRGRGVYLWGPVGTGKTAILGALAFDLYHWAGASYFDPVSNAYRSLGGLPTRVQYWNLPDFFAQMKRSYDGKGRYDAGVIEDLDVILWDDAGKQYSTEHNFSEFFRWLDWFYSNRKAICFSSNYSPEELGSRLAAALGEDYTTDIAAMVDRIGECCEVIELTGRSWRQGGSA